MAVLYRCGDVPEAEGFLQYVGPGRELDLLTERCRHVRVERRSVVVFGRIGLIFYRHIHFIPLSTHPLNAVLPCL
jgi:hypothetical protein